MVGESFFGFVLARIVEEAHQQPQKQHLQPVEVVGYKYSTPRKLTVRDRQNPVKPPAQGG